MLRATVRLLMTISAVVSFGWLLYQDFSLSARNDRLEIALKALLANLENSNCVVSK